MNEKELISEIKSYCKKHGLVHRCAEEMYHELDDSPENEKHRKYLLNFIKRWDAVA